MTQFLGSASNLPPMLTLITLLVIFKLSTKLLRAVIRHLYLRWRLRDVPSLKSFPFIGVAMQIRNVHPDDIYHWFDKLSWQFEEGIVLTWIGLTPGVSIRRPEFMEAIIPDTRNIRKSLNYDNIKAWLGEGLLTTTGRRWTRNRKLLTPAFHFSVLEDFSETMSDQAEILCQCIDERLGNYPKDPINIYKLAINCTLDTFIQTAMGLHEDIQRTPENEYVKALKSFARLSTERSFRPWLTSNLIYNLTTKGRESDNCVKIMHEFTDKAISEKNRARQAIENTSKPLTCVDEHGKKNKKAFLDLLLNIRENDEPLTSREIRNEVDTFMFAGHDTTAEAISWCLFALGNHPKIQENVHKELYEIFGDSDEPATTKQLAQLKYLERVMKESLRFFPSVPIIGRILDHDTKLGKYIIPKDCTLFINIWQMHRDPVVWENPEIFNPDRFLPEQCEKRHPYAYLPFSGGPRNCIGQKFAMLEFKTVLTAILRKWRVKSALKFDEIRTVVHFLLKPYDEKIDLYFTPIKRCR